MQNTAVQQEQEQPRFKPGVYEFYVTDVIREDSNGYNLKSKNGSDYQRLKMIALGGENSYTFNKNIFSRKDVEQIVKAINNPPLTHVFNSESFELENLIGEGGGRVLLTSKEYNGKTFAQPECFMRAKPEQEAKEASNKPVDDDVPF